MAKVKNKRNSGLADKVHNKRKTDINKKKINPFEVHVNREKIKVLGKKSKHDKGLPGVSRAKAIQKRKETLGTEMKLMNKTNAFIDKRIGEKNNQLSAEDKMIARFATERAKMHNKKNIYNLADDEILTHRGQTLEQIEKFDDPRSDDEEEEGGKGFGGLGDDFVSEGHFGGGVLSKTDSKDGAKSHKDLIEQLIAESKKRKAEKQKEKEQTLDLTEKLDSEWKDLQPVVFKRPRVEENESAIDKLLNKAEKNSQDYDKMMRELKFEKRGAPSDGLKSDEKKEKEEREKLEQWQKERLQRMMGDEETVAKPKPTASKHRSAEDLDDNFELDDDQEYMLAYDKDGKPLVPEHILKDFSVPNSKPKLDDGISDTSSDDDTEEDAEGSEEDNDEVNEAKKFKKNKKPEENSILFPNSESDDSSDDESEVSSSKEQSAKKQNGKVIETKKDVKEVIRASDDNIVVGDKVINKMNELKKIKKSEENSILFPNSGSGESSEDESEDGGNQQSAKQLNGKVIESKKKIQEVKRTSDCNVVRDKEKNIIGKEPSIEEDSDEEGDDSEADVEENEREDDLKDLRESDTESVEEIEDVEKITSFFDLKLSEGENLKELLSGKTPLEHAAVLKKLIKSYDPGLSENNKENLSRLFAHLLQYVNDIFTSLDNEGSIIKSFLIFDKIVPHMFDLAVTNKVSTKKYIVDLLREKHEGFRKRQKRVPDLDTLVFFKLICLLYPASDFRHPVTTPALVFMSEILATSRFNDAYSISRGLFLVSLILEYTILSKRFVPSALNFLRGIVYLAANTSVLNPIQIVPPFRIHVDAKILNLERDCSKMAVDGKMAARDFVSRTVDDDFKIRSLLTAVRMMRVYFDYFKDLEAQECLFESHLRLLGRVDVDLYPPKVAKVIKEVSQYMKESLEVKTFTPICREKKRPKALRLYEPDVQEVFTGSKSSKLSREQAESARLKTKYKREMKGAMREIRRDKAYVASVKIRQKILSDNMRKEKVKQIYKDAAVQQGELNKLKRTK